MIFYTFLLLIGIFRKETRVRIVNFCFFSPCFVFLARTTSNLFCIYFHFSYNPSVPSKLGTNAAWQTHQDSYTGIFPSICDSEWLLFRFHSLWFVSLCPAMYLAQLVTDLHTNTHIHKSKLRIHMYAQRLAVSHSHWSVNKTCRLIDINPSICLKQVFKHNCSVVTQTTNR